MTFLNELRKELMENKSSQDDWFPDQVPPQYKLETLVQCQPVYKNYALLSCQI